MLFTCNHLSSLVVPGRVRFVVLVLLLAVLALLWACRLPPVDWWPLAWVAPMPWVLLDPPGEPAGAAALCHAHIVGFCFWMGALHWLRLPHPATSIGWVALSFYFAFYLPVFVGLSRVAVHRLRVPVILAAPIVWTGLELARGAPADRHDNGQPGPYAVSLGQLIQLSDLVGAYGVSFVVMFVAACLARMLPCGRPLVGALWPLVPAAGRMIAAMLYGHCRVGTTSRQPRPASH